MTQDTGVIYGPIFKVADLELKRRRSEAAERILLGIASDDDLELFKQPDAPKSVDPKEISK